MAESLIVRVVDPARIVSKRNETGGGPEPHWYILGTEQIETHRSQLIGEINNVRFPSTKKSNKVPIILKAKLQEKAIAKSNRPKRILDNSTCPVVGVEKVGELLLSATETRLSNLKVRIKDAKDKDLAQVTAIKDISSFTKEDRLNGESLENLKKMAKRDSYWIFKVTLFDHNNNLLNQTVTEDFFEICEKNSIKIEQVSKVVNIKTLKLEVKTEDAILPLLECQGIKELSYFPTYRIVSNAFEVKEKKIQFPKPDPDREYPIIGVVDSGVPDKHKALSHWIPEHIKYIAEQDSDYNHGCFVGGLIAFGNFLLQDEICSEKEDTKIIDIQVLPSDEVKTTLTEDKLITRLDEAVPKVVGKYGIKVFNMSLGFSNKKCDPNAFSTLAIYLDKLQDKYDVIFVIPSGNNKDLKHQRIWPPAVDYGSYDQLRVPADSVRSITVGAIAAKARPDSVVRKDQAASYSCAGPGPAFTIKPDLAHYSGNISIIGDRADLSLQGMTSVDSQSRIVEDVGTSFSTPLISRTLGVLNNKVIGKKSSALLKALLIHNAKVPEAMAEPNALRYIGFGIPPSADQILSCNEHEITLIFEKEIPPGSFIECPFYWPPSLIKDGKCYGEMAITLVAKTPLDDRYGSEYIRSNVTASIQAADKNGEWNSRDIPEYPNTATTKKIFETKLIETLKWKPIKQYRRMIVRGVSASAWRFRVAAKFRDEFEAQDPIQFAMIFTLRDPSGVAPVYNDVVNVMRINGINTNQLQLRSRIQIK